MIAADLDVLVLLKQVNANMGAIVMELTDERDGELAADKLHALADLFEELVRVLIGRATEIESRTKPLTIDGSPEKVPAGAHDPDPGRRLGSHPPDATSERTGGDM